MSKISEKELKNQGEEVIDRVQRGERITITRDGEDVAELTATHDNVSAEALIAGRRGLPRVDPEELRRDLDQVMLSGS